MSKSDLEIMNADTAHRYALPCALISLRGRCRREYTKKALIYCTCLSRILLDLLCVRVQPAICICTRVKCSESFANVSSSFASAFSFLIH